MRTPEERHAAEKADLASLSPEASARYGAMDEIRAAYEREASSKAGIVRYLRRDYAESKAPLEAAVAINSILDLIALDQLSLEVIDTTLRTWKESLEYWGIFSQEALDARKAQLRLGGWN